ncbi:hypothetical protein ACIP9G_05945 [Lysinibacillus sp. NPDC093197]|uniref:hypothetical protein n=1 Tax=Lysinibacillus sp. NPDC093197 TaxID=3364132 RepID=UPI00380E1C5E
MSNYWNKYKNIYIDKNIEYQISKIFQYSTLKTYNSNTTEIINLFELDRMKKPEIFHKKIILDSLPYFINNIAIVLEKIVNEIEYVIFIPVLVINTTINDLNPGAYMFDLKQKNLLLTMKFTSKRIKYNPPISIHWFLDLESAIALFGQAIVLEGTKYVSKVQTLFGIYLENLFSIKCKEFNIYMYSQRFTKDVNLNSRICILLGNNEIII